MIERKWKMVSFIRGKSRWGSFKEVSVCSASCQTSGAENTDRGSGEGRGRWHSLEPGACWASSGRKVSIHRTPAETLERSSDNVPAERNSEYFLLSVSLCPCLLRKEAVANKVIKLVEMVSGKYAYVSCRSPCWNIPWHIHSCMKAGKDRNRGGILI